MKKLPNFLMVGAPKAGTTSVAKYLAEHPDIFMPEEKEPFFFIRELVKKIPKKDDMYDIIHSKARLTEESYKALFSGAENEKMWGEATVHYLYHHDVVIPEVKKYLGDIPIIIILREPVSRAISNYQYQTPETHSFEEAIKLEDKREAMGFNSFWFYKKNGLYAEHVQAYCDNFSNVYVGLFDDLKSDPKAFMSDLYGFLGVDKTFTPSLKKLNQTTVPKNKLIKLLFAFKYKFSVNFFFLPKSLKKFVRSKLFNSGGSNRLMIDFNTIQTLQSDFSEDISKLEKIIQKDLSTWKKTK